LESRDHLPAIAGHFRDASQAGGMDRAAKLFERCGQNALRDLAFDEASTYLGTALSLWGGLAVVDPHVKVRLLLASGPAPLCAGDRGGARATLLEAAELAARSEQHEALAQAALRLSPSVLSIEVGVVDAVLIDLLERARRAGIDDTAMLVEVLGRLGLALYW